MILSHKHRFVFIKGKKVAGTSAEIALSQVCGSEDVITPITCADEPYRLGTPGEPRNYASHLYPVRLRRLLERSFVNSVKRASGQRLETIRAPRCRFVNHMDLRTVLRLVPEARIYDVLCVERSPYAKVMSLANWMEHHQSYYKGGELPKHLTRLSDTIDRLIADGSIRRVLNVDRYRDLDGRVTVKPWTSETLASDMSKFFRSRRLQPVPLVHAKRGASSDSFDPAKSLRPDQISAINEIFAEEFELFGWPTIC